MTEVKIKRRKTPRQVYKRRQCLIALEPVNYQALTEIAKVEQRSIRAQASLFVEQKIKEFKERVA